MDHKTDKPIVTKTLPVKAHETQTITYDLSKFKPGEYVYEVALFSGKDLLREEVRGFRVLPPAEREVTFDKKRVCYLNGEPIFPIILYHSGQLMVNYLNENKKEETPALEINSVLKDIADHGFNAVITQAPYPLPKEAVDITHNAGLIFDYEIGATTDGEVIKGLIEDYNKYNE